MPTIFVSYRRADSASETGRIYDRLAERYGREHVFKDVDSIPPGVNFPDYIVESIAASDVALVVIGPRWLGASSGFAQRRLDDPTDFVRVEIETALKLGVPVIPVLVGGASLPPARRLPESLRPLLTQNGVAVRQDPDFTRDLERVFHAVEYWQAQPRRAPTPAPAPPVEATSVASEPAPIVAPKSGRAPVRANAPKKPAPGPRLAPVMSAIAALLVVAVGMAAAKTGALAALTTRAPTPNVAATHSAQAFDSHFAATETAQARYLITPYTSTAIGPCAPASQLNFWYWSPRSSVRCAPDKASAELIKQAALTFRGFPAAHQSFPDAFVATFDVAIASSHSNSCAQISIAFVTSNPGLDTPLINLCRNGDIYRPPSFVTPVNSVSLSAPWEVKITVNKGRSAVFTVNGVNVYSISSFIGGIASVTVAGATTYSTDVITISRFSLIPTLS